MSGWKKLFNILLISVLVILLFAIITAIYLIFSYNSWKKNFESNISSENIVTSTDTIEAENLEKKIEKVTYSSDETVVLELSPAEVSSLIFGSFQGNESLELLSVYTRPVEKGRWNVFLKINVLNKFPVWVEVEIRKEDRETAEIFLEDILIGKYSLNSFGMSNTVEKANKALSSALITAEENGFVGRTFKNIELLDSGLVVRLEKY